MNSDILARLAGSLADRYEVGGELGVGGMATVYRAVDRKHQRDVADGSAHH
jgi:serine/threonine protein kinase